MWFKLITKFFAFKKFAAAVCKFWNRIKKDAYLTTGNNRFFLTFNIKRGFIACTCLLYALNKNANREQSGLRTRGNIVIPIYRRAFAMWCYIMQKKKKNYCLLKGQTRTLHVLIEVPICHVANYFVSGAWTNQK